MHGGQDKPPPPKLDPGDKRAAGLEPRQIDPLGPDQPGVGPQQDGVAVPAQTVPTPGGHGLPTRGRDQVGGQGRGSQAQPLVGLLQGQDVGPRVVGDPQDPGRIPPPIQPHSLADIVAGQPDEPGRLRPRLRRRVIASIWAVFAALALAAIFLGRPTLAGVAFLSLILSIAPVILARHLQIVLPLPFVLALAGFLTASLLLGEAFDMYERVWWWDIALHGAAAIGLGMAGFLFVLMLFEGDRFAAPIWALTLIAACIAVTFGVLWEVFEFAMDRTFGLSMQKSGLPDTMGDLVADFVGSILGALSGALYLTGRKLGLATALIGQFVRINRRHFRKRR